MKLIAAKWSHDLKSKLRPHFARSSMFPILGAFIEFTFTWAWLLQQVNSHKLRFIGNELFTKSSSGKIEIQTISPVSDTVILICRGFAMPGFSGIVNWIENLADSLGNEHNVIILTQSKKIFSYTYWETANYLVIGLPLGRNTRVERFGFTKSWHRTLLATIKEFNLGSVSFISPLAGVEGHSIAKNFSNKHFVLLVTNQQLNNPGQNRKRLAFFKQKEKEMLAFKNVVPVADSFAIVNDLEKSLNTSIPNSHVIDISFPEDNCGDIPKERIFLFIGRCDKRKNIGFLVELWLSVYLDHPFVNHRLVILTSSGDDYSNWIRVKNLTSSQFRIEVLFDVVEEEKHLWLQRAFCVLVPSIYESFGMVIVEAMQHGCQVITSNVGGMPEVLGSFGLSAEVNNLDAWTTALGRITGEPIPSSKLREYSNQRFNKLKISKDWKGLISQK